MTLRCNMDFFRYPFDRQTCYFRVGSSWSNSSVIKFSTELNPMNAAHNDAGFQVSFSSLPDNLTTETFDGHEYSVAGCTIDLKRGYSSFLLKWYVPTLTLVAISGISFFIPAEIVAGRMALLITIFLMLVNVSNASDSTLASSIGLTGLDLWLRACMAFVAAAIGEYFFLLFVKFRLKKEEDEGKEKINAYCSRVDRFAGFAYAFLMLVFNVCYWAHYLS